MNYVGKKRAARGELRVVLSTNSRMCSRLQAGAGRFASSLWGIQGGKANALLLFWYPATRRLGIRPLTSSTKLIHMEYLQDVAMVHWVGDRAFFSSLSLLRFILPAGVDVFNTEVRWEEASTELYCFLPERVG